MDLEQSYIKILLREWPNVYEFLNCVDYLVVTTAVIVPHGVGKTSPHTSIWASTCENLSLGFTNNKGADQPAHPHSLISALVILILESSIFRLATSRILWLVSVAEGTCLSLALSEYPKTGFVATRPIWC